MKPEDIEWLLFTEWLRRDYENRFGKPNPVLGKSNPRFQPPKKDKPN